MLATLTPASDFRHPRHQKPSRHPPARPPHLAGAIAASSPLVWWRTRPPQGFARSDVMTIRHALRGVALLREGDWRRAVTGDTAVAIGIAVRVLRDRPMTAPVVDIVLSAVLVCALEHDAAAARILLSNALRRRSKVDSCSLALSALWLAG